MTEQLSRLSREQLPSHLPPLDAWKVNPGKLRKFYAPTDDRGFVLPDETVEVVKALFEDEYVWPVDPRFQATTPDVHHLHWMRRIYEPENYHGRTLPRTWRDLPTVKAIVPRQFHNVIHAVTLPPNQPKLVEMERHAKAYHLARRLFLSAQNAAQLQHRFASRSVIGDSDDQIADEMLIQKFDRQFKGYRRNLEAMIAITGLEALRLDIDRFDKRRPQEIVRLLGAYASQNTKNYVPLFPAAKIAA